MCLPVSGYTITHCRCICTSPDSTFSLCFSECFYYCSAIIIVTDCTCIGTSVDPHLSLSLSLSLSVPVSDYIIGNLHVCEQARPARSACNSAIENGFLFLNFACTRTSLDFSFFLFLCLLMSVPLSSYIKLWLIVPAYTSLLRVSYSLSLWISLLVFGSYIVTHWTCICTSLDPCFSLSSVWMLLSVFGNIVIDCPCIVSSLDLHFYLFFSLSVWVSAYITANSACICTSIYPCFSLLL